MDYTMFVRPAVDRGLGSERLHAQHREEDYPNQPAADWATKGMFDNSRMYPAHEEDRFLSSVGCEER